MRYSTLLLDLLKLKQKKRTENIKCDYLEQLELSYMVGRQNGNLAISHKLIIPLPCDPTFPLLDVYPWKMKIYVHTNTCL